MTRNLRAARALLLVVGLCGLLLNACIAAPQPAAPPVAEATATKQPTTTAAPVSATPAVSANASSPASALAYLWPTPLPAGLELRADQSSADDTGFELTLTDPTNVQNQVFIVGGAATRQPPELSSRPIVVRGQNGLASSTGAGYAVYWKENGQPYVVSGFLLSADGAAAIAETLEPLTLAAWRERLSAATASAEPSATAVVVRCPVSGMLKDDVDVSFDPFCVVWSDTFEGELGFRIELAYGGGERFSYTASPNETQFVLPPENAPRTAESRDLCQRRGSFTISVTAVLPEGDELVGGMGIDSECMMGFPPTVMPEATSQSTALGAIDPSFASLRETLAERMAAWEGEHALSVTDLQTGETISVNGARPQLAARTIKIGIMLAIAQHSAAGRYDAADVEELVQSAMRPSSTWPAREHLRVVGDGDIGAGVHRVNKIFRSRGVTDSILTHPPSYPDEEYGYMASHGIDENRLPTDDLNMVLGKLCRGEPLSPSAREYVLRSITIAPDWMDQPMRASLPADTEVYHKIGRLPEPEHVWNDAAIVVLERGGEQIDYAISYLGSYDTSWRAAFAHETELAAAV